MGTTNHGNQEITYEYFEEATAKDFNKKDLDIHPRGVYKGGYLTRVNDSEITLSPFTVEIGDASEQVSVKSSSLAILNSGTLDSGTISSTTPVIVLRWAFVEQQDNYVEVHAIASVGAAQANDIIVGRCVFSGATLTGFNYNGRTFLNVQDLFLRVEAPGDIGMNVRLRAGRIQNSAQYVLVPEQVVGPFAVPGAPNSRIDLVYIDDDGNALIQQGSASPSPSAPSYANKLVVAEVRIVNGDANIAASRVTDVRSFITAIPAAAEARTFGVWNDRNKDGIPDSVNFNTTYLAQTDGEVHALLWITSGNGYGYLKGYTDGSNPPTTMRAATLEEEEAPGRIKRSIRFSVRKGDYWKVDMYAPGGGIKKVYWLPEGN